MHSGLTVGDRFVLVELEAQIAPDVARWRAADTRLGRDVTLFVGTGGAASSVAAAGAKARPVRDAHLARIIAIVDEDDSDDAEPASPLDSPLSRAPEPARDDAIAAVAVERPAGVRLTDVAADRLVPVDVARAVLAQAAAAFSAATARGLDAPAGAPDLTVTPTGRVVVAGAGLGSLFAGAPESSAASLLSWFGHAIARDDEDAEGLTAGERGMLADVDAGNRVSLETLLERLGPARAGLRGLTVATATFLPRIAPPALAEPAPAHLELEAGVEAGVDGAVADDLLDDPAAAPAPQHPLAQPDDMWEFDKLVEDQLAEAENTPSVSEALLTFLQRRFPRSEGVAQSLERARKRALAGPRIHPGWIFLGIALALVFTGQFAWNWAQSPYQPDIDLNNNPPQYWPEFTRGPDPTPSPDAP